MAPRSLNSDISYFGVGGKQAIFFIGTATRVRIFSIDRLLSPIHQYRRGSINVLIQLNAKVMEMPRTQLH